MRIVVLSSARWSSFRLSKHFVALALADQGHDVLYVDPPLSSLSTLRDRSRRDDRAAPTDEHADGVHVWRPRALPGQNTSIVQARNARTIERGIRERMAGAVDLTIAFSLEARTLFARLEGRKVWYATDSLEDLPGTNADQARGWEQQLVDASDLVVACSKPLAEQLETRGAEPLYLPHACDPDAFAAPLAAPPPELLNRPRPWSTYAGSINFRVDQRLLRATLERVGGTLIVVGGAFGPDPPAAVAELLADPSVVSTGWVEPTHMATLVAAADVGLVPYRAHPFNRKSFPIKVLQYLAAGRPVVSTPNGATDELADHVAVAESPERFAALVAEAIATDGPDDRSSRREVARSRTWGDNARRLVDAVGRVPG